MPDIVSVFDEFLRNENKPLFSMFRDSLKYTIDEKHSTINLIVHPDGKEWGVQELATLQQKFKHFIERTYPSLKHIRVFIDGTPR